MKTTLLLLILLINDSTAQILNAGFEHSNDSIPTYPKNWRVKIIEGYNLLLDTTSSFSGTKALKIKYREPAARRQIP